MAITKAYGFECGACGEFVEIEKPAKGASSDSAILEHFWKQHEIGEPVDLFQCGDCETLYDNREEAKDCCA